MVKSISSLQNPLIKKILLLQEKSRLRREENLFVIDGWKETQLAIENGFEVDTVLCQHSIAHSLQFSDIKDTIDHQPSTINYIEVTDEVFDKISYRGNTSKVVALAKPKSNTLSDLKLSENPLVVVLDGIEKPGNVGAILRTADATGVDAVICCDTHSDIYNPNTIRSSVGCVFTKQIAISSKEECMAFLKENKIAVYTTSLKAAKNYLEGDYKKPSAFVFGTEADGVNAFWEEHSAANIIIPMRGQNDSLNVSNAAAIILFEALRQRN